MLRHVTSNVRTEGYVDLCGCDRGSGVKRQWEQSHGLSFWGIGSKRSFLGAPVNINKAEAIHFFSECFPGFSEHAHHGYQTRSSVV